jgi:hypothetical protein
LILATAPTWADSGPPAVSLGLQVGLAMPAGNDLKVTAGSAWKPTLGVDVTWHPLEKHSLRSGIDLWDFSRAEQGTQVPLIQRIDTRVEAQAVSETYLYRPGGTDGPWAVGVGLYLIRWSVTSSNSVAIPGPGTALGQGRSRWTRQGIGLQVSRRLTRQLDAEARWLSSHYGYQNLPAYLGTVGLHWRF